MKLKFFSTVAMVFAAHAAYALNGPTNIEIDGGPFGTLDLSGGADGLFYAQTGTASKSSVAAAQLNGTRTSLLGDQNSGANFGNLEINLKQTSGILQFNLGLAIYGGTPALGTGFGRANIDTFPTSPLKIATVTLAPPGSPVTLTAGHVGSLEGFEYTADLYNANILASDMWYVENSASRGVSATYSGGPFSATLTFGDGWDTGVFNFLQALVSYSLGSNSINVFYGGNLGRTGLAAKTYSFCGDARCTVGEYGPNYINSQLFGAYGIYNAGSLSLTPEVQYVYAKADHAAGIDKFTSNFGAALFADYNFTGTPYSLGGMAEYFDSIGQDYWFVGPRASGLGFELTPTWQYKDLFARVSAGYTYLMHSPNAGYGNEGTGKSVLQAGLEAGVLF